MNKNEFYAQKNWISPKITIRVSPDKGNGMFAVEKIAEGEELVIWGEGYTDSNDAKEAIGKGKLFMQWDNNLFSVEDGSDSPAYCINHSCDSNTWMKGSYSLIARHSIEAGEEVMADYALWESDENYISKWECKCTSSVCRNLVTGKDWLLPELQRRYKDHFSPLINKRIAAILRDRLKSGYQARSERDRKIAEEWF